MGVVEAYFLMIILGLLLIGKTNLRGITFCKHVQNTCRFSCGDKCCTSRVNPTLIRKKIPSSSAKCTSQSRCLLFHDLWLLSFFKLTNPMRVNTTEGEVNHLMWNPLGRQEERSGVLLIGYIPGLIITNPNTLLSLIFNSGTTKMKKRGVCVVGCLVHNNL